SGNLPRGGERVAEVDFANPGLISDGGQVDAPIPEQQELDVSIQAVLHGVTLQVMSCDRMASSRVPPDPRGARENPRDGTENASGDHRIPRRDATFPIARKW